MRKLLAATCTTVALTVATSPSLAMASPVAAEFAHADVTSGQTVLAAALNQAVNAARTESGRGIADPSITNAFSHG